MPEARAAQVGQAQAETAQAEQATQPSERRAVDFACPACGNWCATAPAGTKWLRTTCKKRGCPERGKGRTLRA